MTDPYRIRSVETWARARDEYLAGDNAEAVCRRHDLGLSAFRRRARRHGWRRQDQDDPAPAGLELSVYEDLGLDEQVQMAALRFNQALTQGRATEARRWRRLWQELCDQRREFEIDFYTGMTPQEIADFRRQMAQEALEEEREIDAQADVLAAPVLAAPPLSPPPPG